MQEFEQKNVKLWTICSRIKRIKRMRWGFLGQQLKTIKDNCDGQNRIANNEIFHNPFNPNLTQI